MTVRRVLVALLEISGGTALLGGLWLAPWWATLIFVGIFAVLLAQALDSSGR